MTTLGFLAKATSGKLEVVELSYKWIPILLIDQYWRQYKIGLPTFVKIPRYLSYRVFQPASECTKDLISDNRQPYLVNISHIYVGE